ncbi:hypothetical protein HMPREF9946_01369 [Acetobacteraceae bacterium AT-5844]|nr:hypothetical protein HMPREF9946_01369 [Acetobacteraceae bacterium AT-5844]
MIDVLPDWAPRAGIFMRRFHQGEDCFLRCGRSWISWQQNTQA